MTKCIDFWKKWKKEPNFCGLGRQTARTHDKYLSFVEDFTKEHGFIEEIVYQNVPLSSIKPLLTFKEDSDIRKRATKQIAQTLNDKHAITSKYVKFLIGIDPNTKPLVKPPLMAAASEIPKEALDNKRLTDKIRLIKSVLTSGQIGILLEIIEKEGLDNEYDALTKALIWAKERYE